MRPPNLSIDLDVYQYIYLYNSIGRKFSWLSSIS